MLHRGPRSTSVSLMVVLALLLPAQCVGGQDLLDLVRTGHQSTVQSFQTFACRVTVSQTGVQSASWSGEYWRSPEAVRSRMVRGNRVTDFFVQNSKVTRVIRNAKSGSSSPAQAGIRRFADQPLGDCDVWMLALFAFAGPDLGSVVTLDRLLEKKVRVGKAERGLEAGRELFSLSVEHELSGLEMWFDPQVNYLVRKHTLLNKAGKPQTRSEAEVVRFREVAPGIHFPEQVNWSHYLLQGGKSKLLFTQEVKFTGVRVNHRLPDDVFQVRLPAGTQVADSILDKTYTVDASGKPTGPMRDMIRPLSPQEAGVTPRTETREEPKPVTRWLLPASVLVLAAGVCLWAYRKWKLRDA